MVIQIRLIAQKIIVENLLLYIIIQIGRPIDEINYKIRQDGGKMYWKPRNDNLIDKQDFNLKFSAHHFLIEIIRKILPQKVFRILFYG